tara:strand:+ start:18329 stop:19363 length:1035 start_codon:yes stop_codon:yes gene_type:complete
MKPVFRWTIGNCTDQGIEILWESVRRAIQIYEDTFRWYIFYNNLSPKQLHIVETIAKTFKVKLVQQSRHDLPIPQMRMGTPKTKGVFDWDGNKCGGTVWKLCPPRIDRDVHEIIMDNDIVFTEKIPEIDEFLNSERCLILQDNYKFYGRFSDSVKYNKRGPYNSGLIGVPPNFYFGDHLTDVFFAWSQEHRQRDEILTQADEQGLVAATITNFCKFIVISNTTVCEFLDTTTERKYGGRGIPAEHVTKKHLPSHNRFLESIFSPERKGFHFCQANRLNKHFAWELYKNFREKGVSILKDFGSDEVARIAHRGYVEGYYGSWDLARNWSKDYSERKLAIAKGKKV